MPVLNRIGDLETGISSLQDPSFLSQFLSFSVRTISQAYSFWIWGALILALVASFGTLINRIRFLIIKYQNNLVSVSPSQSQPFLRSCLDGSEEDDACSSSSCSAPSSETEEDEIELTRSPLEDPSRDHEVFVVRGSACPQREGVSSNLRRRRSFFCDHLSGFCDRTNIVQLWNLGLEIGVDPEGESPASFGEAALQVLRCRRGVSVQEGAGGRRARGRSGRRRRASGGGGGGGRSTWRKLRRIQQQSWPAEMEMEDAQ
ncbi:uncharacterized protein LOC104442553 [Eucalyptus grandis]|uniref:uncharacterized protein LOC104442553 n=1 Tax=Eucalyptus grandis TaxID=71139 RepID=UPI0005269555|nr:uncharacterized protein LOC104442553 [Eucalyptus grandis]